MKRYDDESCRALRDFLRAHIKTKYGPVKTAAHALGLAKNTIYRGLNGVALPPKALLQDAGVVVERSYTIAWSVNSDNRERV